MQSHKCAGNLSAVHPSAWAAGGKAVQLDWRDEIINAQSLDELAALWKKIPKDEKAALEPAKNTRKKELEIPGEQLI